MTEYTANYSWNPEKQRMDWGIHNGRDYIRHGFKTQKQANAYIAEHLTGKAAGAKTIEERHQEDLAHGRMIWVRLPDGPMCHHMTMTEFEEAKKEFNRKAIEVQKETGADCVIYATKTYNEDGSIKSALLDIIPLDRAEYDRRTQSLGAKDEMVYTVYKREAAQNTQPA